RVAAADAAIVEHGGDTEAQPLVDHLVDVGRGALGAVGAERDVAGVEVRRTRRLGDDVDAAAGRAAAAVARGRTLVDLDLLDVERLARLRAGIAHAVDEDVAARIEAANVDAIAQADAALGRA